MCTADEVAILRKSAARKYIALNIKHFYLLAVGGANKYLADAAGAFRPLDSCYKSKRRSSPSKRTFTEVDKQASNSLTTPYQRF